MLFLIAKRVLTAFVTVLTVIVLSGILIHVVPGDPVTAMMAQSVTATPEVMAEMRSQLGLDLPVWQQVVLYASHVLTGDLGTTIRGNEPVARLLFERLPNTFALAVSGLSVALLIGIPLGFLAAINRGRLADTAVMVIAVLGVSIPGFWLGLIMIQVFSLKLGWFPVAGSGYRNIVLPALTLGLTYCALVARMTRSALVDILAEDYIRTARARGLREHQVLFVHALKPALISIVTVVGLVFAYLMGGQVIVENVFSWNGIGRLAVQAMLERDYPMIQGFIVVFASSVVIVSMLIDILYGFLDPRMRQR
ncbi:peptide/nickel transport system permease protein/oligopeptide transport system permease protein [Rhizobium sp. PP-F2F-G38]|uniref:ABC transporter permease n=1 Tax=Ferranicluibacter rubi TaxID=2715133 RepID=A0AA44CC60_9HYPH|nr:ABC transporter permease [Ferranicluibacter rubi]NHT75632.1 ABC transporter permease [Ferranicluibacter rubi]PYE32689.1 peptide/nickel transport system permease protein/oligopeptide transport system permease protein [Rhizobium sp. PP-WC-1G-195]PYE96118.1 peptide/nickel transport system permease protein/oligopeptide transport system permease protein [Rhizobium sp. PP-F2F-G38]TCQ23058.1 peptide/nickel transport system permease protein/oligopeptide transport system permease protein [Rhizobium s